jgi:hypothetical protein
MYPSRWLCQRGLGLVPRIDALPLGSRCPDGAGIRGF